MIRHIINALIFVFGAILIGLCVAILTSGAAYASPAGDAVLERYNVEPEAVEYVETLLERVFPRDPVLFMALIGVESAWKPWAVSSAGAVGLAQVMPNMHGPSAAALYDITINLTTGASLLEHLIQAHGIRGGLRRYNGAGPAARRYVGVVLKEYARLGGSL